MRKLRKIRTQHDRDYDTIYRKKMYGWVARMNNKHRVKTKGLSGDFSVKQWDELVKKYDGKCAMCGKVKKLTYDHKIPLSKWTEWAEINKPNYRANDIENIQPLCSWCNKSKGAK